MIEVPGGPAGVLYSIAAVLTAGGLAVKAAGPVLLDWTKWRAKQKAKARTKP